MGANAQTSVPLFVANSVLTAAQQNISAATGIPVFSTTVTRDAAFGGSNKVLAEGQLCYLESTDVVQYYTGAAWATVGPSAPGGLVCVKAETTFTAASTAVANGIFTSTYSNYRILIKAIGSTNTSLRMQLAVSGTPATTTYSSQVSTIDATTVSAARVTSQASFLYGDLVSAYNSFYVVDISSPQLADNTLLVSCAAIYGGSILTYDTSAVHATATAYDGLVLFPASGTFTGTYSVYGYSKTV